MIKDIISKIDNRENGSALILANGFEFFVTKEQAFGISSGMRLEAVLCKNLVQKLCVDGKVIFSKTKEQLLPEMEVLSKELLFEAEDERRMEINLEANKKLTAFIPILKIRIAILQTNTKSFMQHRDWRRELKIGEIVQKIYFLAKKEQLWKKISIVNSDAVLALYPDFKKLDRIFQQITLILVDALFTDCRQGIDPENSDSVKEHIFYAKTLRIPNILGEEVRVVDIVRYKG